MIRTSSGVNLTGPDLKVSSSLSALIQGRANYCAAPGNCAGKLYSFPRCHFLS